MSKSKQYLLAGVLFLFAGVCVVLLFNNRNAFDQPTAAASTPTTKSIQSTIGPVPNPEFGWIVHHVEKFVLDPGAGNSFPIEANKWGYAHYSLEAAEPVNAGIVLTDPEIQPAAAWQNFDQAGSPLCYAHKALTTERTCIYSLQAGRPAMVLVRDTRTSPIPAAVGAILGDNKPAKSLLNQNRVTVTFYTWGCVKGCPTR
jgi:hypothetical protein